MAGAMVQPKSFDGDESLLRRIVRGDDEAATEIFERHAPALLVAARRRLSDALRSRVDPEDIVQSTFKSFFRRASHGGYTAPKTGDLFNLLIVIAMRKISGKSEYHQSKMRDVRKTVAVSNDTAFELGDDREAALRELCMTVAELLEDFNETQCAIIQLRLEGYSVSEIAAQTNRSKRTVERELQAFRGRLSKEFAP